jgi:hypothetical protein
LCPSYVATFYENLEVLLHTDFEPQYIWNCDESGAQAGRNGGGTVERFWQELEFGVSIQLFRRSGSGCQFWCVLTRQISTFQTSTYFAVRVSNETILSNARTMQPCFYGYARKSVDDRAPL